jgi:cell wall assembly regulator SMI1
MASISASWRLIEGVLWENAHSVYRALRGPVSDTQLRRLEKRLPGKLPRDFVKSLRVHDGMRDSHSGDARLFDYWAFLPVSEILHQWRMMTDLQAECEFEGNQFTDTPRLKNDAHWRPGWVPFMDADGDKLVIDLDPGPEGKVGQVFEWYNYGGSPMEVLADSFSDWLADLAMRFSKRQFRLSERGHIWLPIEEEEREPSTLATRRRR